MTITLAEFSAHVRTLFNIYHADVEWMSPVEYQRFAREPVRFFLRADDETQARIWQVVEWRNRPRPQSALMDAVAEIARTGAPPPVPLAKTGDPR